MSIFVRSPFKCNTIEKDPITYGLREDNIKESLIELCNDHSLLISGTRGIGKSSFSVQLQNVLGGDTTLLERCNIKLELPYYITASYVCMENDTLEDVVKSLNVRFLQKDCFPLNLLIFQKIMNTV